MSLTPGQAKFIAQQLREVSRDRQQQPHQLGGTVPMKIGLKKTNSVRSSNSQGNVQIPLNGSARSHRNNSNNGGVGLAQYGSTLLSRQKMQNPHNLNSFQTLSTTVRSQSRTEVLEKTTKTSSKVRKSQQGKDTVPRLPIGRHSSAGKRHNQTMEVSSTKRTNSGSKRLPTTAADQVMGSTNRRKSSAKYAAGTKENSNSRANQTLNVEDMINQSSNDIHNFSTIVKPLHDTQEDRSLRAAPGHTAVNGSEASGQFSIFEKKNHSLPPYASGGGGSTTQSTTSISTQQIVSGRRPPPSQRGGIFHQTGLQTTETPKFTPEILAFKSSDVAGHNHHQATSHRTLDQTNLNPVLQQVALLKQQFNSIQQDSTEPQQLLGHRSKPQPKHNTITYLLDQDDETFPHSYRRQQKRGGGEEISLDSCLMCLKTKDKLLHLLTHLRGPETTNPEQNTVEQIIEGLDAFIEDLLTKDREVELGRAKVNADVEKLIQNQESFERRVAEMDQVYAMLMSEQKRLKERKAVMDNLQGTLPRLTQELAEIRGENERLRYEVSVAVEEELVRVFKGNGLGGTFDRATMPLRQKKSLDMPLQIGGGNRGGRAADNEADIDRKRQELVQWEDVLLQKSSQMEEAVEQFNQKMNKMTAQKAEVQANVKKLQLLTVDYKTMVESELKAKRMQSQIRDTEQHIDKKMHKLEIERASHKEELKHLLSVRQTVGQQQEQLQMQLADNESWLMREREQLDEERDLVHQLRSDTLRQKQAWADSVLRKESQMRTLASEKKEELSVMEIAIRKQIQDAKLKEQDLYQKEDELRRAQLEQLTDFELQKKTIIEERRWLESVRDEVDSKMNRTPTSSTQAKQRNNSRLLTSQNTINNTNNGTSSDENNNHGQHQQQEQQQRNRSQCDMPRQMPSEIDRQIQQDQQQMSQQQHQIKLNNNRLLTNMHSFDGNVPQRASIQQPPHHKQTKSYQGDLSEDQAFQLDILLSHDQHTLADFGGPSDDRDKSLIEDSCDKNLRREFYEAVGEPPSALMRASNQSSVFGGGLADHELQQNHSSIVGQDEHVMPHYSGGEDMNDCESIVPPTFRGDPSDRQNAYFSLTEQPQVDRKQESNSKNPIAFEKQLSNPLRQSEANIFSKPMNPYTVLEAKLDEMKEEEELLFQFKPEDEDDEFN